MQGDIVITEFFIKPDKELDQIPAYIELFNNDTIGIDLEGWSIMIYNHLDSLTGVFIPFIKNPIEQGYPPLIEKPLSP